MSLVGYEQGRPAPLGSHACVEGIRSGECYEEVCGEIIGYCIAVALRKMTGN